MTNGAARLSGGAVLLSSIVIVAAELHQSLFGGDQLGQVRVGSSVFIEPCLITKPGL